MGATSDDVSSLIQSKAELFGDKVALVLHGSSSAESYTFGELAERAARLSSGLIDMGLGPGDRVALLSESRPRWAIVFFAVVRAGAIVVPLDVRLGYEELEPIVTDASPRFLIVSEQFLGLGRQLKRGAGFLEHCLLIDEVSSDPQVPSMDALAGAEERPRVPRDFDDTAIITYTSGTMGQPKGVMTSFANVLFQIQDFRTVMGNDEHEVCVSILPLNHLFELVVGLLGVLYGGGRVCYCSSLFPQDITAAMRDQSVTCMITVPLFLKLLRNGIQRELRRSSRMSQRLFAACYAMAPLLPIGLRRRLFARVHTSFGGRLRYFVCGGAPLESDIGDFFARLGVPVYQGYGMAEASPVISTNRAGANRPGSVGRPMPGVEVSIQEDGEGAGRGEILTRGPHIMKGYYNRDDLTQQVVDDDGWLHTGDIGYLDADGYLYVSGRAKNLIVLGSGKKVQPEELEEKLFDSPLIKEGSVLGRVASGSGLLAGTEEVWAVVVPSDEAKLAYANRTATLREVVTKEVQQTAQHFADYKRPRRIIVRMDELPKTSTRKVRRVELHQWLDREEAP